MVVGEEANQEAEALVEVEEEAAVGEASPEVEEEVKETQISKCMFLSKELEEYQINRKEVYIKILMQIHTIMRVLIMAMSTMERMLTIKKILIIRRCLNNNHLTNSKTTLEEQVSLNHKLTEKWLMCLLSIKKKKKLITLLLFRKKPTKLLSLSTNLKLNNSNSRLSTSLRISKFFRLSLRNSSPKKAGPKLKIIRAHNMISSSISSKLMKGIYSHINLPISLSFSNQRLRSLSINLSKAAMIREVCRIMEEANKITVESQMLIMINIINSTIKRLSSMMNTMVNKKENMT